MVHKKYDMTYLFDDGLFSPTVTPTAMAITAAMTSAKTNRIFFHPTRRTTFLLPFRLHFSASAQMEYV